MRRLSQIKSATLILVSKTAVFHPVSSEKRVSDETLLEANAELQKGVILRYKGGHRTSKEIGNATQDS